MNEPENEHQEALKVLNDYYAILTKQMAEEILEHREDFKSPGFGSHTDELIEKYSRHIQRLGVVYGMLRWKAYHQKPEGKVPLGKYDFRCFGCGGIISSTEEACSICGWTWR
jgi:hypothetical protein